MNFNKAGKLFAAGLMMTGLLSACIGGNEPAPGSDNPQPKQAAADKQENTKIETPTRPERAGQPSLTFKFGDREAKAYELKGSEDPVELGLRKFFIASEDALYFFRQDPKNKEAQKTDSKLESVYCIYRQPYKNETLGEAELIDTVYDTYPLSTNGKIVYYVAKDKLPASYDGSQKHYGEKLDGLTKNPACVHGSDEIFFTDGDIIYKAALKDGKLEGKEVFINGQENEALKDGFSLAHADAGGVFVSVYKTVGDKEIKYYNEFDKKGNLVRSYEGVSELPRDWAVTANYVIATGSKGIFKIYDRSNGKLIEEAQADMRPFSLYTVVGNDVLVYDDRAKKLYRIDF
ncbi:hypothetical protein IJT93_10265 [bacterium]|nr:hypothetical protein [bacterium]